MSKVTDVNNLPATGAEAMFILKETLKSAGWTVTKSSDGTTYNASGDEITSGGSGANGMANSRAWFVIQSPAGSGYHEWCFQRETASDNQEWRIKMSAADGFSGGTPGATQVPSATDEQVLHGSGTDASPTMADVFPVDASYRWNVIAEDAAVGSATPMYGFWAFAVASGTSQIRTFIMQEPMSPGTFPELSSGTRAAPVTGDPDPCIYCVDFITSGNCYTVDVATSTGGWQDPSSKVKQWFRMNYGDENFDENIAMAYYGASAYGRIASPPSATHGVGVNPYTGDEENLPIYTGRSSGNSSDVGSKGASHFLRMSGVYKAFPETVNLGTAAMVHVGNILVPWEDSTVPLA